MPREKKPTIVWAIDPFNVNLKQMRAAAAALKTWTKSGTARILPVSIVSPDLLSWPSSFDRSWESKFSQLALARMKKTLSAIKVPGLQAPIVIVQPRHSRTEAVRKLIRVASVNKSTLIVASAHDRPKAPALFTGRFTETLISLSKTPVLVVPPSGRTPERFSKVLFATDFSKDSSRTFGRLLNEAARLEASVVIYHQLNTPITPVLQSAALAAGGGFVSVEPFLYVDEEEKRREGERWLKRAETAGVRAHLVLERGGSSLPEAALAAAADQKAQIIALATQSGRVSAALIGSVARQIVRLADRPVWLVH